MTRPGDSHISTACGTCKKSKRKCTGTLPCDQCTRRGLECTYREDADGRRQLARKRKAEELEADSRLLHDIIDAVRNSSDESVAQIVSLARSNASLDEAKRCITEMLDEVRRGQREPSPELERLQEQLTHTASSSRRGLLDIARLTDQPPIQVPASPWTSVTQDSTLVSHLISVFMVWVLPFYNWVHEDLFLRDMRARTLGAPYCSPFLVNAVLAAACLYSDYDESRSYYGTPSAIENGFREEAQRLLRDMEAAERASIPTMQGLCYLLAAFALHEGDGLYAHYATEAFQLCEDFVRSRPLDEGPTGPEESDFREALSVTCWGLYNLATILSLIWQLPVQMAVPSLPRPPPKPDTYQASPYPVAIDPEPCHNRRLLYHRCDLSLAYHRYANLLFTDKAADISPEEKLEELQSLYQLRSEQRQALPTDLRLSSNSTQSVLLLE